MPVSAGGTTDDLVLAELRLRFAAVTANVLDWTRRYHVEDLRYCRFEFADHFVMHASVEMAEAIPKPYLHLSVEMVDQRFTLAAQSAEGWNQFLGRHLESLELQPRQPTTFRIIKNGARAKLHAYFYGWQPSPFTTRLRNLPTQYQ